MTWFKVDDKLCDHKKSRTAGTAAMGMWVLCGSWASGALTDGFIPTDVALRYGTKALAKKLVDAQLWDIATHDGEKGWQFHDWADQNPTREKVLSEREAAAARQATMRAKRRESHRDVHRDKARDVTRDVRRESHDPDPTRPEELPPNPPASQAPPGGSTPSHHGQHPNCRACGTNHRATDPDSFEAWLASQPTPDPEGATP